MMLSKLKTTYFKYEKEFSYASLILGFVVEVLALKRIDRLPELLWIGAHVIIGTAGIILFNKFIDRPRARFWALLAVQYTFGGLLSACIIFYFRGTTLLFNWPFLVLLVIAFLGNEYFKKHFEKLAFQIAFLFFSLFSFNIFFIPIVTKNLGDWTFILSGIISLAYISLAILVFYKNTKEKFKQSGKWIYGGIVAVYALINILYFTNLIPPIPLALKDVGAYYAVTKLDGNYILEGPQNTWLNRYSLKPKVLEFEQPISVYSSIFSPTNLNLAIVHEWQYVDGTTHKWTTASKIHLNIRGGREEGFRTYSQSTPSQTGKWRVNIRTVHGALIGRVRFNIQ